MSTHATGSFEFKSWDETPYSEVDGEAKLTRASVTNSFTGDFEGEGAVEYLMAYANDSNASFVGLERLRGRLGGRMGSFVLQHSGTFEGGLAKSTWYVVPGTGTGELSGLRGHGGYNAHHGQPTAFTLDYDFE